jgi:clan AA aspartic protease (TIGR02281 family)
MSKMVIKIAIFILIWTATFGFGLQYFEKNRVSADQARSLFRELETKGLWKVIFNQKDSAPTTTETIPEDIIIPLTRKGRALFVQVELNEYREATLIVDTGASETALTSEIAFELGLIDPDSPEKQYHTANGTINVSVTTIDSIRLGDAIQYNVPVSIIAQAENLSGIVDGLLGMSFFEHYVVSMDSSREELHLRPRSL